MISLEHYTITKSLHEGAAIALGRGVPKRDGLLPIVIRWLRRNPPATREIERLCRDDAIGRQFDSSYTIKGCYPFVSDRHATPSFQGSEVCNPSR
jgi:hypothetical protein